MYVGMDFIHDVRGGDLSTVNLKLLGTGRASCTDLDLQNRVGVAPSLSTGAEGGTAVGT